MYMFGLVFPKLVVLSLPRTRNKTRKRNVTYTQKYSFDNPALNTTSTIEFKKEKIKRLRNTNVTNSIRVWVYLGQSPSSRAI